MSVIISELKDKTIQELTALVSDKRALVSQLAEKHNKAPMTISNHWLNGFYSVPKALAKDVKADLITYIQNEKTEQ